MTTKKIYIAPETSKLSLYVEGHILDTSDGSDGPNKGGTTTDPDKQQSMKKRKPTIWDGMR